MSRSRCRLIQMKYSKVGLTILFGAASLISQGQTPNNNAPKPDNTKVNQRDRNAGEVTADQQKTNPTDQELTRKIRQSIMADKIAFHLRPQHQDHHPERDHHLEGTRQVR